MMNKEVACYEATECEDAISAFHRDGVVVLSNAFDENRLAELKNQIEKLYPEYGGNGQVKDSFDVGSRRFTAPLPMVKPLEIQDIVGSPALTKLLSVLLGPDFVFEALGVIVSLANSPSQQIHRDGGDLFGGTGLDSLLPAYAVTIVVPLVDVDETNGPTKFWLSSHRSDKPESDERSSIPVMPRGSLTIWDFRLYHAGQPNRGSVARPLLYMTACRPFWHDHQNFVRGKNAKLLVSEEVLESYDGATRKRFERAILID